MNLGQMAHVEQAQYLKIANGIPPHQAGLGTFPTGTCVFACLPIGILHACDPYSAAKDAYELFSVWVDTIAQEAPMAIAAAVAEAFRPAATRDSIVEAARAYSGRRVREFLDLVIEVAAQFDDPWEALPTFHEKLTVPDGHPAFWQHMAKSAKTFWHTIEDMDGSGSPLEMAGLGLAFFHVGNGDPIKAIGGAASFGRDCDGFAGIAGAITGAWKGVEVFDMDTVNTIDAADRAFYGEGYYSIVELAQKMQAPILSTLKAKEDTVSSLRGLLQPA